MYKLIVALFLSVFFHQTLMAVPYTREDFAHTASLSKAQTSLRQLELPLLVYKKMRRSDYGDLRVFNAGGQIVPHQFSGLEQQNSKKEVGLTYYPFNKEQAINADNIRVIITQKQGEQRLQINQQSANKGVGKKEYQYIIKNPKDSPSLCRLKLDWTQNKPSMILPFKLESSSNLQNWKTLATRLTVSKLNYGGSRLTNQEVKFSCTKQKYLRLSWLNSSQTIHLNKIHGIYIKNGEAETPWSKLGKPNYDEDGNWLFETNVIAAITEMEFVAPQDGLLYKGALYSRNNTKQAWRYRQEINQYRLNMGETQLQSSAIQLRPSHDRYWKLVLVTEGQFSDSQLPEIRVGWSPKQLQFLAQGKGPFQLAFGNPAIKAAHNNDLNALMQSLKESDASIDQVTLGEINTSNKSFEVESKIPWKLILLWLVLILGTALMAFMAYRLYQQMGKEGKN